MSDDFIGGFMPGGMDDDERDEEFERALKLPPRDALAVAVATLQMLDSPIGGIVYPGWKQDMVAAIVRCNALFKSSAFSALFIQIGVTASVVTARLNQIAEEVNGEREDPDDATDLIADPAALLHFMAENVPSDDFFEKATEFCRGMYSNLSEGLDPEKVKELEDWFNGGEAEEPDA